MSKKKVIVAGHICLDITPVFSEGRAGGADSLLSPGKLIQMGKADVHTGGAVANTGLAMKILGKNTNKFEFQCGRDYYYLPFGEIMYFVSEGRKIRIITPGGEREFYGKLMDVTKGLPPEFVAIHKSYTVNREYILRYTYESVELTDGTELTISKANRKLVREKILDEGV